ncbi:uncharacterized protein LOC141901698 [Tubulanus polymorphus]|uniref:uncharacterized protein LOC141901698 n=1 Tax=Tubulanus polymorphus TaxID=672921 RepID=UPI003DA647CA
MAQFGKNLDIFSASRTVKIIGTQSNENFTLYIVEVSMGRFSWTVKHRYSEFHDMHEKLVADHKIDKNILPPKKIFGKMSESFIKRRQMDLEIYIQSVLHTLNFTIPPVLAHFLDFHKYEIHGITESLAETLYLKGDGLLQSKGIFSLTPLQLYAINERLKLAEPTCESGDKKKDIGHILDFVTLDQKLRIVGSRDPVGDSNIDMNALEFDMTVFRNLEHLEIVNCNAAMINGVEVLKRTVKTLSVRHTINSLKDILMRDVADMPIDGHGYLIPFWLCLRFADFSHNEISSLEESVKLIRKVEHLNLSHNKLLRIEHLSELSELMNLDLSHNALHDLNALHTKLGNLKKLNLSGNNITSLQGLSKLYSLEILDLSSNDISKVMEVSHISRLPCLEKLLLMGNPVTIVLDYRTKVFELFGDRCSELCLDNLRPSQKELDTVAILQAIHKARQGREKSKKPKKQAHSVSIADLEEGILDDQTVRTRESDETATEGATREAEYFRLQVETIRAQGGEGWLSLLNDIQISDQVFDVGSVNSNRVSTSSEQSSVRSEEIVQSATCSSIIPPQLPGVEDSEFVTHVKLLISSLNIQTHIPGITGSPCDENEHIFSVLWCRCYPYRSEQTSFFASVVLTNEMLHIFKLKCSTSRKTDLSHVYSIPINNLQEVIVGYCGMYARVEEAFIGSPGTFTFRPADAFQIERFVARLRDLCKINDQDVLLVVQYADVAEQRLQMEIQRHEPRENLEIVHYTYVETQQQLTDNRVCSAVALTRRNLYLIHENILHFPIPTFEINATPTDKYQYEIVQIHPLVNTVKDVQFMTKSDECSGKLEVLLYGLELTFESVPLPYKTELPVGSAIEVVEDWSPVFKCFFLSAEKRDLFLCQLMQQRRKLLLPIDRAEGNGHNANFDAVSLEGATGFGSNMSETTLDEEYWETAEEDDMIDTPGRLTPDPSNSTKEKNLGLGNSVLKLSVQSEENDFSITDELVSDQQVTEPDQLAEVDVVSQEQLDKETPSGQQSDMYKPSDQQSDMDKHSQQLIYMTKPSEQQTSMETFSEHQQNDMNTLPEEQADMITPTEKEPDMDKSSEQQTYMGTSSEHQKIDINTCSEEQTDMVTLSEKKPDVEKPSEQQTDIDKPSQQETDMVKPSEQTTYREKPSEQHTDMDKPSEQFESEVEDSKQALSTAKTDDSLQDGLKCSPAPSSSCCTTSALPYVYENSEFVEQIETQIRNTENVMELSSAMKSLSQKSGDEIINYFHNNLVQCGLENEELRHILWSPVIPYASPDVTVVTCIFLSSKAIYIVSDEETVINRTQPTTWQKHVRTQSDSTVGAHRDPIPVMKTPLQESLRCIAVLPLKNLKQVDIGLFDQCFRLAGIDGDSVYTCMARSMSLTDAFVHQLMSVLMKCPANSSSDYSSSDSEQDIYARYSRSEPIASQISQRCKVKFVYASEESIAELCFLIHRYLKIKIENPTAFTILSYLLVFRLEPSSESPRNRGRRDQARSIILTDRYLCIVKEDYANYPLLDFVRSPPDNVQYEVCDVRRLEYLRRVVVSDFTSNDVTFEFSDHDEDIVVDPSKDYFRKDEDGGRESPKSVSWTIIVQNSRDKDKLLKLIGKQWSDCHNGSQLSIQVST